MSKPRISVIVPTFNRASWLSECLDAILTQRYRDFELIVVDDGSQDNTPEVLAQYAERVRMIRQENRGVAAARNVGIQHAHGDYLAFCDSDDLWQRDKLQLQLEVFQNDPAAMVCYTDEIWLRNGEHLNQCKRHLKLSGWIFDKCLDLCIVSPSSVMMRRDFFEQVGLFDETLVVCEDYDLWLRASLQFPFHFISKPLIVKRGGHADQLSQKYWGMDHFRALAIVKCLEHNRLTGTQRHNAIAMLIQKCTILAHGAHKHGRTAAAQQYEAIMQQWRAVPEEIQE